MFDAPYEQRWYLGKLAISSRVAVGGGAVNANHCLKEKGVLIQEGWGANRETETSGLPGNIC